MPGKYQRITIIRTLLLKDDTCSRCLRPFSAMDRERHYHNIRITKIDPYQGARNDNHKLRHEICMELTEESIRAEMSIRETQEIEDARILAIQDALIANSNGMCAECGGRLDDEDGMFDAPETYRLIGKGVGKVAHGVCPTG